MRRAAVFAGAALSLLAAVPLPVVHAQAFPSDSAIRELLQVRVDSGRAPGIVVGLIHNGQRRIIVAGSAGPGRAALDGRTIFEIGSITKTFNALLLADAVVRGQVALEQPVAELLPDSVRVPTRDGLAITLEQLATHHSGLPRLPNNLMPANALDPYAGYDAARLYEFLSAHALTRVPGASAEYSNLGAGLLGHALVSYLGAESWEALVRERVTAPLGMHDTHVMVPADARGRLAAAHNALMDTVPGWYLAALAGAGALRSTADDMLTYLEAQLDTTRGPLARGIAMTQPPRGQLGSGNMIGLGWIIGGSPASPMWWHNGGTGGFRSFAAFDPARNMAVVVLANSVISVDDIGVHLMYPGIPLRMPPVPARSR